MIGINLNDVITGIFHQHDRRQQAADVCMLLDGLQPSEILDLHQCRELLRLSSLVHDYGGEDQVRTFQAVGQRLDSISPNRHWVLVVLSNPDGSRGIGNLAGPVVVELASAQREGFTVVPKSDSMIRVVQDAWEGTRAYIVNSSLSPIINIDTCHVRVNLGKDVMSAEEQLVMEVERYAEGSSVGLLLGLIFVNLLLGWGEKGMQYLKLWGVTGTLGSVGDVGKVKNVNRKVVAANQMPAAGLHIFLVPRDTDQKTLDELRGNYTMFTAASLKEAVDIIYHGQWARQYLDNEKKLLTGSKLCKGGGLNVFDTKVVDFSSVDGTASR